MSHVAAAPRPTGAGSSWWRGESTCTDVYGSRYAMMNAGMLYTARAPPPSCAARQRAGGGERGLALRVRRRSPDECRGSNHVPYRAETAAGHARQRYRRNALNPSSAAIEGGVGPRLPS